MIVLMVAPAAFADRPDGMDTSSWDGDLSQSTWNGIYNQGYVFAWVRATRGTAYLDSEFYDNIERAPNAGIYTGPYHVCFPYDNPDPKDEVDYFVSKAGDYISGGYLRPVLDLERGSELSKAALSDWVNDWLDELELQTGVEAIIYTNTNYATYELDSSVADRDLWIAQYWTYPDPEEGEPDIGVFNSWAFWQWTANCTIEGVPGSADCDVFNGTMSELEDYVIPGGTVPPFIVESRSGGLHYSNYSETGTWSNGSSKSTAPGCTSGIGHRWCTINSSAKTAVFKYTPTSTGTYEIFTTNCNTWNSGDPLIHKVTHAGGTTNVEVCQNVPCGDTNNVWYSLGQYTLNASTQYKVTLDGSTGAGSSPANNAGRSDAVKWTFISGGGGTPPTVTQDPEDEVVDEGETASFTVAATGDTPLSYQWQKDQVNLSNGGDISGATSTNLQIANCEEADEGDYRCVVTNSYGSDTSNEASLTVNSGAQEVLVDDFDSYSTDSQYQAAWPISVGNGGTLSTAQKYSSPNSIYFSTSASRSYQNFTATYGTDSNPLEWSIEYYDNNANNLDRQYCQLLAVNPSLTQLLCIGTYNSSSSMRDYYAARIAYAPGPGWIVLNGTGAPERTIGWHEIKAVIKSTTIDFYVDDVLAKSGVSYSYSQGTHDFDQARLGSGLSSTSWAYFDDFSLTGGQ
jgi:lysozyme